MVSFCSKAVNEMPLLVDMIVDKEKDSLNMQTWGPH